MRRTAQRTAIQEALEAAGRPLSVEEILEAARADAPKLGIATVYRNIKVLLEAGEIAAVELPGQPPRYEQAGAAHHHHFHCDGCGKVYDLPGCRSAAEKGIPEGFRPERHEVTVFGQCADCA